MSRRKVLLSMLLLCTLLRVPAPGLAISTLSLSSPEADGVFVLRGEGLEDVAGFDIWVTYDSTTLSNPRVEMGSLVSGMISAVNPGNPVKMAIVSGSKTVTGSGTIATIAFDRSGASPGRVTAIAGGGLIDLDGKKVAMADPVITNPVIAPAAPPPGSPAPYPPAGGDGGDDETGTPATAGRQPFMVGGTLTLPPDATPGDEANEPSGTTAQQENPEHQAPAVTAAAPPLEAEETRAPAPLVAVQPAPAPSILKSVLEQFRLFQGERTVNSLASLFSRDGAACFSQTPAIGLADGKATVRLTISKVAGDKAPKFVFNSARFVSLAATGEGEWEVELRPDKDAVSTSVSMFVNGVVQELPLTVAPPAEVLLKKPGEAAEAEFELFLRQRDLSSAPQFDLNGDGRRDYVDDYIFTANYLVKMEEEESKTKRADRKAVSKAAAQ